MKTLLKSFVLLPCLLYPLIPQADTFYFSPEIDAHNMLMFKINHRGFSNSMGFFKKFEGKIELDQENLANSSVEATIDMGSIDLANFALWNKNTLDRYLNYPEFPQMTYVSTEVQDLGNHRLAITGDLTLLGVTREVILDAQINKIGDYRGYHKAGFSATGSLKRSEFGSTAGLPDTSDDVFIFIELETLTEGVIVEYQ